jgi:hypothetical protein
LHIHVIFVFTLIIFIIRVLAFPNVFLLIIIIFLLVLSSYP